MKNLLKLLAAVAVLGVVPGCAINRSSAMVVGATDLGKVKSVYVTKLPADERGINVLIADKLRSKGLAATTGPGKKENVDAVVTYEDKWMWDITMYMLELTVTVRDPATDYALATGNAYHTSLTRKSPKEMVDEVIDNIYAKGGKK